jgi:hypothetical protein
LLQPVARDVEDVLAHLRIVGIKLGQARAGTTSSHNLGSFISVQWKTAHEEPVQVRRFWADFQDMVELEEAAARMIENAVQHDPDAALMRFGQQLLKALFPPKSGSTWK